MLRITIQDISASLSVSFLTIAAGAALGEWAGIGALTGIVGMAAAAVFGGIFGGISVKVSGLTATTGALYITILETTSLTADHIVWAMFSASALLLLVGFFRPSRIMAYIPNTVIAGFVNGIALLLIYKQLQKIIEPEFTFGIESYIAIGAALVLLLWRRGAALPVLGTVGNFISGSLVVMALGGVLQYIFQFDVTTLSLTVVPLSSVVALPALPSSLAVWTEIAVQSFVIAFIVLVSTLITARALDGNAPLDAEIKNQSITNAVSGLLGAFPTSIGFVRTTILKRNHAVSPFAGVLVGVWTLVIIFTLSNFLAHIPTAIFVGILLIAGWRALDWAIFKDIQHSHNYYLALGIFLTTTYLTFIGQLALAVIIGSAAWRMCGYIPRARLRDLVRHKHGIDIT